ncbi:homologous-pairing protein 2 homolog [Protopterus annectens]|uniref:homologous-pairing protein 2 homolog n=1 Tax=Protopterus annectens TaxID=7888 RepID=UPI001CF9BCB9|nr:homologous-pairing protein 2 homolog [Protopterus annectens]
MKAEIELLKVECSSGTEKLKKITSTTNHVTLVEIEKVYNERKQYVKEWKEKKRMATDLIDAILEGYPKTKKQFFEEDGLETDEVYKVTIPNL